MIRLPLILLLLIPTLLSAQTLPERRAPYVNDYAGLLSVAEATGLSHRLAGLHFGDGVEITVLTLTGRAEYGHSGTMEDLAYDLFQAWQIGATTGDDGILVLVLWDDQEMRIELGAAYGTDFNATAGDVIDQSFLPGFLDEQPGHAILNGVEATIDRIALAEMPDIVPPPAAASETTPGHRRLSGEN